ncbi:hypothetical protein EIP86_007538 [Pleurotus ostreatoroseus]|nr:hypothetical protein EIP86_007538 [Pleurotus ostreatoroseus]
MSARLEIIDKTDGQPDVAAFMIATATQNMFIINNKVCDGMIGLAFQDSFSALNDEIRQQTNNANNDDGANAIFNIFAQNPDVPTFFDMQLSRANDPGDTSSGSFIVGSHVSGFENVSSQPHLPVINPGRWAVPLDQMSVNGKTFQFNQSVVSGVPSGKILVDIDSGFSFPPIPSTAVDFIYSSFPGASLIAKSGTWIVPCNGTTDLKFTFGGVDFPMHYLDLTQINTATLTNKGQKVNVTYCSNTFTYGTPSASDGFDANLGDPFMRNAYVSFNYNGLTTSGDGSFIQMLPTTNLDAALPDFQSSRSKTLAGMPPELSPSDFVALSLGLEIDDSIPTSSTSSDASPTGTTSSAAGSSATTSASSAASTPTDSGSGGKSKNASSSVHGSIISLLVPLFAATFTVTILS